AEIVMRIDETGIELHRVLERGDRAGEHLHAAQKGTYARVAISALRLEGEAGLIGRQRLALLAHGLEHGGEIEMEVCLVRRVGERATLDRERLRKFPLRAQEQCQLVVEA